MNDSCQNENTVYYKTIPKTNKLHEPVAVRREECRGNKRVCRDKKSVSGEKGRKRDEKDEERVRIDDRRGYRRESSGDSFDQPGAHP